MQLNKSAEVRSSSDKPNLPLNSNADSNTSEQKPSHEMRTMVGYQVSGEIKALIEEEGMISQQRKVAKDRETSSLNVNTQPTKKLKFKLPQEPKVESKEEVIRPSSMSTGAQAARSNQADSSPSKQDQETHILPKVSKKSQKNPSQIDWFVDDEDPKFHDFDEPVAPLNLFSLIFGVLSFFVFLAMGYQYRDQIWPFSDSTAEQKIEKTSTSQGSSKESTSNQKKDEKPDQIAINNSKVNPSEVVKEKTTSQAVGGVESNTVKTDGTPTDQLTAQQVTVDKAATDKAAAELLAATDKAAADKVAADKATADKAAADKAAADKATADKATADKAATDQKIAAEKALADKAAADKALADALAKKAAADKAAADALADQAAAQKAAAQKVADEAAKKTAADEAAKKAAANKAAKKAAANKAAKKAATKRKAEKRKAAKKIKMRKYKEQITGAKTSIKKAAWNEAQTKLISALRLHSGWEVHALLGKVYFKQKKFIPSVKAYKKSLKKSKRRANTWLDLGRVQYKTKQYSDAKNSWEKAKKYGKGSIKSKAERYLKLKGLP